MNAAIYTTTDGTEIILGLQGSLVSDEAIRAAKRIAADRGTDVLLVDDDGEWIVHPDGTADEAPAANVGE